MATIATFTHTIDLEVASVGLPIIIEVVDTQAHIDEALRKLEPLMDGVVVMMERARVIRYLQRSSPQ